MLQRRAPPPPAADVDRGRKPPPRTSYLGVGPRSLARCPAFASASRRAASDRGPLSTPPISCRLFRLRSCRPRVELGLQDRRGGLAVDARAAGVARRRRGWPAGTSASRATEPRLGVRRRQALVAPRHRLAQVRGHGRGPLAGRGRLRSLAAVHVQRQTRSRSRRSAALRRCRGACPCRAPRSDRRIVDERPDRPRTPNRPQQGRFAAPQGQHQEAWSRPCARRHDDQADASRLVWQPVDELRPDSNVNHSVRRKYRLCLGN